MAQAAVRVTWRARFRTWWRALSVAERIAWISAIALVVLGMEIGGFFVSIPGNTATAITGGIYVINRFTGSVSFCIPSGCRSL
jgi:hypothetical protein